MRFTEAMLNIPEIFLLIVMAKFFGGKIPNSTFLGRVYSGSLIVIIVIIGLTSWMYLARIVRAEFLSLKANEFVLAARATGTSNRRDHLSPYPAQLYRSNRGDGHPWRCQCHPGRGLHQFPWPGCSTSDCHLGQHARWSQPIPRIGSLAVVFSRLADSIHRLEYQFSRRWPAGCTGSARPGDLT